MRKLFTLLAAALLTASIWAQIPQKMSYQAVIRDASGKLVTNQVRIRLSILQAASSGTAVYVETQTPTPNANGLITIEIGGGSPVTFAAIDWSAGPYFIKTETDTGGGTNYTITDTSQLLSVPYALYAKTAGGHYIGELFGGGIVVSVWKDAGVEHGLITSLTDISSAAFWSDVTGTLAGASSGINGQANTTAILAQSAAAPAAKLCNDYSVTVGSITYDDWYLPASWELKECYNADYVVNSILGTTNGFQFANYWSSTENDPSYAWYMGFNTGNTGSDNLKRIANRVRAIRKF